MHPGWHEATGLRPDPHRRGAGDARLGLYRGAELGTAYDPATMACPTSLDPATVPSIWFVMLGGIFVPFTLAGLQQHYPSHDDHVAAVTLAADAALQDGAILPEDRDRYVQEAARTAIGRR